MSKFGVINQLYSLSKPDATFTNITVGEVVDVDDPQQMGRVRAICPAMGDIKSQPLENTPWAIYGSPFAGVSEQNKRGRDEAKSNGPVAYGFQSIPNVGSQVLIMCIDGDPAHRVWLGCIPGQFFPHTMPHGRFTPDVAGGSPSGPLTSSEDPLEPLHSNITQAFTNDTQPAAPRDSFEYRSRAVDRQVAYLSPEEIATRVQYSKVADARTSIAEADGNTFPVNQGYTNDLAGIRPGETEPRRDSNLYSWTTPGFHSISFDDTPENCRARIRTTAGHQIIFDDTNERIYISTAQGKTWIEIDEKGTIDIYGEQDISVRSEADLNLIADKAVRISGKEGIHFASDGEFRVYAKQDISIKTDQNFNVLAADNIRLQSTGNLHIKTSASAFVQASSDMNFLAGGAGAFQTSSTLDLKSGGAMSHQAGGGYTADAPTINFNSGGSAANASPAENAVANEAFQSSRVPDHEPWARVYSTTAADGTSGNTITPEYGYSDPNVGRGSAARSKDFARNSKWHR